MLPSIVDSVAAAGAARSALSPSSLYRFSTPSAVLSSKRKVSKGTPPEHRREVVRGAKVPMVGVLGEMPVAGTVVHAAHAGGHLHLVFALCGHKYSGRPVINDAPFFLFNESKKDLQKQTTAAGSYYTHNSTWVWSVTIYDGAQTHIDHLPTLKSAPGWSGDMIGKGIVLAHVRLYDHSGHFPSGIPDFLFHLDAREPGQPALSSDVILRYLRNDFEATDDELYLPSFDRARIICDEPVITAAGANENRYTAGGAYDFDESHADVLERLLQTCGGKLVYQSGRFSLYVAAHYGDPVLEITEADIIGDVEITPMPERRDLANIITGTYTDALSDYQTADFPEVASERYLLEDGEELEDDFDLEYVQRSDQAQRLASLELNRHRLLTVKLPCNFRAFGAKVGRVVRLNMPRVGFNAQTFMVEAWEFSAAKGVVLTLREDFPGLWDDYIGAVPDRPPLTNLPSAGEIAPPSGGTINEFQQFNEWICELTWQHEFPGSVRRYHVTIDRMIADADNWQPQQVGKGEAVESRWRFRVPAAGEYRATILAENNFGALSEPYEFWYNSTIPTLEIESITAERIDVTAYPARALVAWTVERLDLFEPEAVVFTVETRPHGSDNWLPVTKTGKTSCWVEGLAHGSHEIRINGTPPYGQPTGWRSASFTVDAVTVPSDLAFTADSDGNLSGLLSWAGAGQSWDVELRKNGALWAGGSVTAREWPVPAVEPGLYVFRVRARAGDHLSDFAQLDWQTDDLPAPVAVSFVATPANAASSATVSWSSGGAGQFTSGYELQVLDSDNNIDLRTVTHGTEYLLPVLLAGAYTVRVRAVSTSGQYFSPWAQDSGTVSGLAAPENLTATESLDTSSSTLQQLITVNWRAGDDLAQSYELEYRRLSETEWTGAYSGAATTATLTGLAPGDYYLRVRSRLASASSDYSQITFYVQGMERAPDNVTGAQFRAVSSTLALLSWDLMTDPAVLSGGSIHVRHTHLTGSAATWEGAVPLTDRLPGNATLTSVPLLSGTYMLKAVNAFSRWSKTSAVVQSNIGNMLGYNRVVERAEPQTWPGESNGGTVSESAVTLAGQGAYYTMVQPLDLGAVFTARLTLQIDGSVYLPDLIDDRGDAIDSWALFDGKDPGNTSLIYEVSQTDDDPGSSSAKWSSWTQFLIGEFRARAFRLRVSMQTDDPNAVGTIAHLKLIADVPDRTERGLSISCPAAGLRVSYDRAFLAPAAIAVTGQGMSGGDRYAITNSDNAGFNIRFYSSSGGGIARTFDFFAISYGEQ